MATARKVYRFRMRPTKAQAEALARMAGARRWVWNWALRRWKDHYAQMGRSIPMTQLSAELTALKHKPETTWLGEVDSQALQQALKDLHRAFSNFFQGRSRYPRFKSRKRDAARFRIPQRVKVVEGTVFVPKVGKVRIRQSQPVGEQTKSATFRREADGHWSVSLTVELALSEEPLAPPDPEAVEGIDLGLKDFAVFSDGERVSAPRFYRKAQGKLRRAQRRVSRREQGSRRQAKAKAMVARLHRRTANKRSDFLHKLSTQAVREHEGNCIEDLGLRGLARTKLAKSFTDASLGEFRRQLTYKSQWQRKHLVVVHRFFPSSKRCSECGAVRAELPLKVRAWTCEVCGAAHDRDVNAAKNLREEGLRMLAAGHADSGNARGAGVRPPRRQPASNRESHRL